MGRRRIVTSTCPHCGNQIRKTEGGSYFRGSPIQKCKACGKTYYDKDFHEPALEATTIGIGDFFSYFFAFSFITSIISLFILTYVLEVEESNFFILIIGMTITLSLIILILLSLRDRRIKLDDKELFESVLRLNNKNYFDALVNNHHKVGLDCVYNKIINKELTINDFAKNFELDMYGVLRNKLTKKDTYINKSKMNKISLYSMIILLITTVVLMNILMYTNSNSYKNSNLFERSYPRNGEILIDSTSERVSPLEVITEGDNAYVIKLFDTRDDSVELSFFIRPGSTAEVNVPIGNYIIKYATGQKWYGIDNLFGSETRYYQTKDSFNFTYTSGWTVELIRQTGGNLDYNKIDDSEFK